MLRGLFRRGCRNSVRRAVLPRYHPTAAPQPHKPGHTKAKSPARNKTKGGVLQVVSVEMALNMTGKVGFPSVVAFRYL